MNNMTSTPDRELPPGESGQWELIEQYLIEPWRQIIAVSRKLEKGESLSTEEQEVPLFLTGLKVPAREFIFFLKKAGPDFINSELNHLLLFPGVSGFLKSSGYYLRSIDGMFLDIIPLRFPEDQVSVLREAVAGKDRAGVENCIAPFLDFPPELGWVAVINPSFFSRINLAHQDFLASRSLAHYLIDLTSACAQTYREQHLEIFPGVDFFSRLEEFLTTVLDFDPKILKDFIPPRFSLPHPVGIKDRDIVITFGMGSPAPERLGSSLAGHPELATLPPEQAAEFLRQIRGSRIAVCLELEPLIDLMKRIIPNPFPWEKNALHLFIGKIFRIIRDYNRAWGMSPAPLPLKPYIRRLVRLFRLPYDLLNLDDTYLPRTLLEELSRGVGGHNQHALIFIDRAEVKGICIIEIFHGGFRRLKILHGHTVIPPNEPERLEWLKTAKFALWNVEGWMNYAIAVDLDLLRELGRFLTDPELASPLKAPIAFLRLVRIMRRARKREFLLYPRLRFFRLGRFTRREGILNISYRLLNASLRRKKQLPRRPT